MPLFFDLISSAKAEKNRLFFGLDENFKICFRDSLIFISTLNLLDISYHYLSQPFLSLQYNNNTKTASAPKVPKITRDTLEDLENMDDTNQYSTLVSGLDFVL